MTNEQSHPLAPDTIAVRGGFEPGIGEGITPPIHLASTFVWPADPAPGRPSYGRGGSPGFDPLEQALAQIELGRDAVVFNAGVAATVAILEEVKPGQALVMPSDVYYGFRVYAEQTLVPRGIEVRFVDHTDLAALDRALAGAAFLWTETPTNPTLNVVDLAAVGELAAHRGVPWACDNTFASPLLQHPLEFGATVCMHSLTKYAGGHSDLILGAAITRSPELATRLRARRSSFGTQPDGFSCWLARRGLQTMPLRVRQQSANALALAERLTRHPAVERVYYPGLPEHPGHDIATRQMQGGFGGMFSFIVRGGAEGAQAVLDRLQLWTTATSLGSVESLIERRARWTGEIADPALLRASAGIEHLDDLWFDLDRALSSVR